MRLISTLWWLTFPKQGFGFSTDFPAMKVPKPASMQQERCPLMIRLILSNRPLHWIRLFEWAFMSLMFWETSPPCLSGSPNLFLEYLTWAIRKLLDLNSTA
ncbi:hypothetical protein PIB30_100443 [Stylosanthes scabra]|uniref:Uncharacterized protein n=1 Tax=Stylosanthes scabra TaxID=79078 RepID=A0ABU6RX12_9FABA|nr:hypothetical protein [Stylosanthes scabra]